MTVLAVTGASGLIGTEFVKLAREKGLELRLFSRSEAGAAHLDLRLPEIDPKAFEGCDAVLHLAARLPSAGGDLAEARDCFEVNALGTLKLMEGMQRAGVARLIHATAANAYAPWCEFPDEQSPLYPLSRSFYLGSKVMQELYAHAYGAAHGLRVTSLRISSPYGASSRSTVGRLAESLVRRERIKLQNGGVFGADFIHVSDVAQAILLIHSLEQDGNFNVASGHRRTMFEVATWLCELTGADPELVEIEAENSGAFKGYPAINIAKIRELGFAPTDFEVGLQKVVADLRAGRGT